MTDCVLPGYIGAKAAFKRLNFAPAGSEITYLLGECGGRDGRDFGRDIVGARGGVIRTEEGNNDAGEDDSGDEFERVIGFHFCSAWIQAARRTGARVRLHEGAE